jgi:hypothetical protein
MICERPLYRFRIAEPMVGDVNLFFNDHYDRGVAEAEIMIAGVSARSFHSHEALEIVKRLVLAFANPNHEPWLTLYIFRRG